MALLDRTGKMRDGETPTAETLLASRL